MQDIIYFDNSATTKVSTKAAEAALYAMNEAYGNPSSLHGKGVEASRLLKKSRDIFLNILGSQGEIIFTSGGTESNNTAITGIAFAHQKRGNKILISAVEHPSVSEAALNLKKHGFEIIEIPVDSYGKIKLDSLEKALTEQVILVSVQHVNSENGTIQPLTEIGSLIQAKAPHAFFHIDAVQGFAKIPAQLSQWNAHLYTASGHKIHAPKGSGILWVKKGVRFLPLLQGGGQERNLRSGTENVPAIYSFGIAAQNYHSLMEDNQNQMQNIRDYIWNKLSQSLPESHCNTNLKEGVGHILNISFPSIRSEVLLHYLEGEGIYVSSGSACHSNKKNSGSPVLKAMGLPPSLVDSALRLSFSPYNTLEEAKNAVEIIIRAVKDLGSL